MAEPSRESLEISYHLGGPAELLRPALGLVMLVPVPNLIQAFIQVWYWTWTLAVQNGFGELLKQLGRLDPDALIMLPMVVELVAGTLMMMRASAAFRGGSIDRLRRACLLFALTTVAVAGVSIVVGWMTAGGRHVPLERQLQTTLLRASPELTGTILPVAAYWLVRKLTTRAGS